MQLKDFKSGLRQNDVMGPIAAKYDKSQMQLLAKYFSEQKWPNSKFVADAAAAAKGETATGAGQCVQCHDPHHPKFQSMKPLPPLRYPARAAGGLVRGHDESEAEH